MKNEYCDKFQQLVLLILQKNGFEFTYPPLETARPYGYGMSQHKKMPVFEVKLSPNGKRTRLHFWIRENSNCVEHTEKENFHFPTVPHTFLRLGHLTPKFRQMCTIAQKQLIFRGFKCDFWIPHARYLACTNFQGSSQSRSHFMHKKHHFLMLQFYGLLQHT